MQETEQLWQSQLIRYRENLDLAVREIFQVTPERWQTTALKALAEFDHISIRSGHGVGKTAFLSWLILLWVLLHDECRVPVTAPTSNQLYDIVWAEMGKWHRRMPPGLRDVLTVKADHLVNNLNPKGSFAVARTARRETPEAFQGFHEANMLFIADEASGVDDIIFEVGEGSMSTTGAKTVLTGNPTRTVGYFYNSHHRDRAEWFTMKVACADSSQVDPKYIERMEARYGKDSNIYKIRVLGDFPTEDEDAVIPLSLIEDAIGRDVETSGQVLWGLDVARQGQDRCALAKRRGNTLLEPIAHWKASDLMVTAGRVHQMYIDTPLDEKPEKIYVDVIGMGYGVLDRLRGLGMPVMGVNVAEAPAIGHTYNRLRDELWFKARDWFMRRDCKLPNDESLMAELSIPKFYYTQSGKIRVTPKEDIKKMGLQSPDLADAFCLTFAVLGDRVHRGEIGLPNIGAV